jgi:AcrR family transcriptional regulator
MTIEDRVTETGLSRGALYLYFPNKEALCLALADRLDCGLQKAIQQRVTPTMSPCAVIGVIIELTGSQGEVNTAACHILMEGRTLAQIIPELGVEVRRQQEQAGQAFEQLLRAGVQKSGSRHTNV